MKRFILGWISFFLFIVSSGFVGCANDSGSDNSALMLALAGNSSSSKPSTLSARLASASSGDVIDIEGEGLEIDATEYTISKNVTIKNGDLTGVSFTIADSESRANSALAVILEELKGLAALNVLSGGNISITKTEITSLAVQADSASLTVVSAKVETLKISGESSKLKVSSTTVSTLTVGEGVESVALGGTTEITTLTVVNISTVEIVKTSEAVVTNAKDNSGADISGEIGVATGILRDFLIRDGTWTFSEVCFPDAEGVYTVQYKQLKDENPWNFARCGNVWFDTNLEKDKNYKISFKAKASADIEILAEFQNNAREINDVRTKLLKGEWTDIVLYTPKLIQSYDVCEVHLVAENWKYDVDIQYKDFEVEETADAAAPLYGTDVWCKSDGSYTLGEFAQPTVDSDGVVTIDFKKNIYTRYNLDGCCNIIPLLYKKENLGKLHKVSYEVMVENAVSYKSFGLGADVAWKENDLGYGHSWANQGLDSMPTGTWVKVIEYVPTSATSRYHLYDNKDPCDVALKIWIGSTAVNTIKVRNFELEVCEEMPLTCFWANQTPIYHAVNIEYIDGLRIPANTSISGKVTFAPETEWVSKLEDNTITACSNSQIFNTDYLKSIGVELSDVPNADEVIFSNTTSKDIYLRFDLQKNGSMNFVQELNPAEDEQFVYFDPHPMPEVFEIYVENVGVPVYENINWVGNKFTTKFSIDSTAAGNEMYVELFKRWYNYPYDSEGHTGSIIVPYGSEKEMSLGKAAVLTSFHDNGGIGRASLPTLEADKTYKVSGVWDDTAKTVTVTITQ